MCGYLFSFKLHLALPVSRRKIERENIGRREPCFQMLWSQHQSSVVRASLWPSPSVVPWKLVMVCCGGTGAAFGHEMQLRVWGPYAAEEHWGLKLGCQQCLLPLPCLVEGRAGSCQSCLHTRPEPAHSGWCSTTRPRDSWWSPAHFLQVPAPGSK